MISNEPDVLRIWPTVVTVCAFLTTSALATIVEPPTFEGLVNGSDYIVRAKVMSVEPEIRLRRGRERIYTRVELQVLEVIAGTPPSPLVLTMLGGRSGNRELVVDGAPRFQVGNEDILFVQGNGRSLSPLFGMMHGQYPVMKAAATKRAYISRSNLVPMLSTDEVAQPMAEGDKAARLRRLIDPAGALSPAEFVRAIKNVRQTGRAHENMLQ